MTGRLEAAISSAAFLISSVSTPEKADASMMDIPPARMASALIVPVSESSLITALQKVEALPLMGSTASVERSWSVVSRVELATISLAPPFTACMTSTARTR